MSEKIKELAVELATAFEISLALVPIAKTSELPKGGVAACASFLEKALLGE